MADLFFQTVPSMTHKVAEKCEQREEIFGVFVKWLHRSTPGAALCRPVSLLQAPYILVLLMFLNYIRKLS